MNWTIKYGEKPMSKKPNRQIKFQFFRVRNGNWSKDAGKWLHDDTTFSPGLKERLQRVQTERMVEYVIDYAKIHGLKLEVKNA
jgi:phage gp16-like protein